MKIQNYFWIVIAILVCLFAFRECSNYRKTNALLANVISYEDSVKTYKNKNGDLIAYNQTLEFENKKQMTDYLEELNMSKEELKKWKQISPVIQIKTEIKIQHDTIPFHDTIPAVFKPIKLTSINKNYSLFATIEPKQFILDSLRIPNEQTIIVGEKKIGLFKREKRVEVVNSNPLIQTTNLGSYALNDKKKWYQTTLFKVGVGVVAGLSLRKYTMP